MRTLTPTLQTAIAATGRLPAIQVRLADDHEHWSLYRTDAQGFTVTGIAACTAGDGSLIRAAIKDHGAAGTGDIIVQRITNPATAAQWTTWTNITVGNAESASGGPIALSTNPGNVIRLFYGDGPSAGATIKVSESTNNGATWSAPANVFAGANSFFYLASAGNDDLFACRNTAVGVWDVQFFKKTAGVWAAPVTWSIGTFTSMYGLTAQFLNATYYLGVSLWLTSGIGIEAYTYNGAAAWTDLNFIVPLDGSNLGMQYRLPTSIVDAGLMRITYVEHDDGSIDGTLYDRVRYTKAQASNSGFDGIHWSNQPPASPQTLTLATAAPIVNAFGYYFATTAAQTWAWQIYTAGDATRNTDFSAATLGYQRTDALLTPGMSTVRIDNAAGINKTPPGLVRRASLHIDEGYIDASGTEIVTTTSHLVESWEFKRAPGENELIITAKDIGSRFDSSTPILYTWTNRTVLFIIMEIAARCRIFDIFWPGTAAISYTVPTFSAPAGQPWRNALHRILQAYALEYVIRADNSLVIHDPSEVTPNSWTFAGETTSFTLGNDDSAANHIRLYGQKASATTTQIQAEAWDYTSAEAESTERYMQIVDRTIDSNAKAQTRVANELLLEQRRFRSGIIQGPINPGFEVNDIITVNDPDTNNANSQWRLHTINARYDVEKGEFDMTLHATAP